MNVIARNNRFIYGCLLVIQGEDNIIFPYMEHLKSGNIKRTE
ncbi:hypothetical protein HMPREF0663_10594 [Hoylesella oralis ATCC 33269]|uniref:Uncharacterized protein n=1 Tax=Hoylesella oralis ATCC 33269 TaxID=873533 RepID=E7RN94_9BACT|nr:hypothetical protein HMPREF0663_10594 [Hoylesella oralis ATCC 33269]